jgi:hypothetical protein
MKTRHDYKVALDTIGAVVRAWDPYGLLAGGAPQDEFDGEIAKLATHIPHIHSAADATQAVSIVFSQAFEPVFTPAACTEVGAKLFSALIEAGLLLRPNIAIRSFLSTASASFPRL